MNILIHKITCFKPVRDDLSRMETLQGPVEDSYFNTCIERLFRYPDYMIR